MFSKGEIITILKSKDSDRSVSRHPDRSGGFIHLSVRLGASISMILIGL